MVILNKKKYEQMMKEIRNYEKKIGEIEKKYKEIENTIKELAASIGNYNSSKAFNEIMDEYLNGKKKG